MKWFKPALPHDQDATELLQSNSRKVIITVGVIYLLWHMLATLAWPHVFSPSLWVISLLMLLVIVSTLHLLPRAYWWGQVVWFTGTILAIVTAYGFYQRPEAILMLAVLPMMAVVMMGIRGTMLLELMLILLVTNLWRLPFLPILSSGYELALVLAFLAAGGIGWGMADNLMSATDAALYHYQEALKRLNETREHRAEISTLLREQSKANYQLERLNEMLEYARTRAEEAREARDRFALSVSHELRSPLNFIIGFSDLMVNSPDIYAPRSQWPAGLYEDIQQVYHSSTHLLSLINDILDMGRMDARQMTLFKERLDVGEVIQQVSEMIGASCQQKGLRLILEIQPNLPLIYADRTRIRQVLINLASNAMRHTEAGSITIMAQRVEGDRLEVLVKDTGTGISAEDLGKLFEEFRQVGSSTQWNRHEGTGLGLSIGKRFIELHGGQMLASSELGQGSVFGFTLPLHTAIDDLDGDSAAGSNAQQRPQEGSTANSLLLFLSENRFWARIFAETLHNNQVSLLEDPDQLAGVVQQLYPRALLVDRSLAQHPAVQSFVEAPPFDLPIIYLTVPVDINRNSILPDGVTQYLVKPVARQVLQQAVSSLGGGIHCLLVVDDDAGMLRFFAQVLRADESSPRPELNYDILTAYSASEAWEILQQKAVDAVFLDLELPDMNGLNLLEKMRSELPVVPPVVIISANDLPRGLTQLDAGNLEVQLVRPFNRQELGDTVAALVENIAPSYQQRKAD